MKKILPLLLLFACNQSGVRLNETGVVGDGTDQTGGDQDGDVNGSGDGSGDGSDDPDEDLSRWDNAVLVVLAPESGDFLPFAEPNLFEAIVYDADGQATNFSDINWRSNVDNAWGPSGDIFEDDALDVGRHALTAEAILPNGDRLAYTIGGVLVQHPDAGTYVGDVRVNLTLDFGGQSFTTGCVGATTIFVDEYGETALGDSTCVVNLNGFELEIGYLFDLEVEEGRLDGEALVDLQFFELPFPMQGTVGNGALSGEWVDDTFISIDGVLNATRISRDIPEL